MDRLEEIRSEIADLQHTIDTTDSEDEARQAADIVHTLMDEADEIGQG
jgi:hypothetical protein